MKLICSIMLGQDPASSKSARRPAPYELSLSSTRMLLGFRL